MSRVFNVTVNGATYEVEVEEVGAGAAAAAPVAAPVAAAPVAAPKAAPAPKKAAAKSGAAGSVKIENEIVAPQDGTIASIETSKGAAVETGAVLATMN